MAGLSCSAEKQKPYVVLYCSVDQEVAEPMIQEFTKATGIEVKARYDDEASKTVGLVQRLRAQKGHPEADVFWSNEILYTIQLAREGLLGTLPADMPGGGRQWQAIPVRARAIGYNTKRVPAEQAPKKLEDLLDARWKGRLVMAFPEFGTTGGDIASWFAHYGLARAREILQGLKANHVRLVQGNSEAAELVATGQADVCLTDTDDIQLRQRDGMPIGSNYLNQGDDGVLVIPNSFGIVAGTPHPELAKRLAAHVQAMISRQALGTTIIDGKVWIHSPETHKPAAKMLDVPYERIADCLPEAIKAAGEILH